MSDIDTKRFLDRILIVLCVGGLCAFAFIGGVWLTRTNSTVIKPLSDAFEGGEAWLDKRKAEEQPSAPLHNTDEILQRAHVDWDTAHAFNGYTLITLRYATTAYLLDMAGHIVYRWSMPFHKAWPHPAHIAHPVAESRISMDKAVVFPNGDLLAVYSAQGDTPYGYGIAKIDKHSNLLWTYNEHANHDLYVDKENGNIYALIHDFISRPPPGLEGLPYPMLADSIVILSPGGKELKRISILTAFRDSPYADMLYHRPVLKNMQWDHLHTNSIMKLEPDIASKFPMFKPGQILISLRHLSAVAVVDPDSGKVIWAAEGPWKSEHSARFLPNGHIMMFDNLGYAVYGDTYSRLLEFDPATLAITWSFSGGPKHPFFSAILGHVEHLPNNDILVTAPLESHIFEITPDKKIVWSYQLPNYFMQRPQRGYKNVPGSMSGPPYRAMMNVRPNLASVIMSAIRYKIEDLPFLMPAMQEAPHHAP